MARPEKAGTVVNRLSSTKIVALAAAADLVKDTG